MGVRMIKKFVKRYLFFFITLVALGGICLWNITYGLKALRAIGFGLKEMILVIPPIFILLGLLDVWVPRESMVRFMGEGSGIKGIVIAIFAGSAAAGPLYGAFPVAAVFLKKGASLRNVFIFLGAWSTTKIPMFLFEYSALGARFALTRMAVDIPGIIIIGLFLNSFIREKDRKEIVKRIEGMDT